MISVVDREQSHKSDHELRREEEVVLAKLDSSEFDELDLEDAVKQTTIEFEDACVDELKAFQSRLPDISKCY